MRKTANMYVANVEKHFETGHIYIAYCEYNYMTKMKMENRILILIIILQSISQICVAQVDYYTLVDSAESCIKEHRWDRAELFLKRVLTEYPDDNNNSLILSNLATVQRYQGKNVEALKNYSYAINMTPNAVTLLKNRASLYLDMDSVEDACNDYERIIHIDENDEESRYYHGILSIRLNRMEDAKKDFDYILFYNPASGLGREGLALWYKERADYVEAVKHYSEIIKQRPTAILLSNRAECYLALKRLNDAGEDIRKALEMSPEDGYLYVLRAKLHKARFSKDDMEADLRQAEKFGIDRELAMQILNKGK